MAGNSSPATGPSRPSWSAHAPHSCPRRVLQDRRQAGWTVVGARLDCIPAVGEFEELVRASKALSAASMPLFMALCVPLILGMLRKPGLHPISAPPGKVSLGML